MIRTVLSSGAYLESVCTFHLKLDSPHPQAARGMRASLVGRACKLILKAEHARSENKTLRQQSTSRPSHRPSDDDSDARRRRPGKVPVRLPAAFILRSRYPLDCAPLQLREESPLCPEQSHQPLRHSEHAHLLSNIEKPTLPIWGSLFPFWIPTGDLVCQLEATSS
jgi:hypothetical protein